MLNPIWIVAFSGHRPKPGEPGRSRGELEACRGSLRAVLTELRNAAAAAGGSIEFLSSLADGADQIAVGVAEELEIPVHIILPMPRQAFARDFESHDSDEARLGQLAWIEAERLIARAEDPLSGWTLRVTSGDSEPPGCYHDTNLEMMEAADVLLTICRGDLLDLNGAERSEGPPPTIGSTVEVIRMAGRQRLNVPTIVIDPARGGAVVRRDPTPFAGRSEARLKELQASMRSPLAQPSRASPSERQRGGQEQAWLIHQALDHVANHSGGRSRSAISRALWLHFGATVLAAISAAFVMSIKGVSVLPPLLTLAAGITLVELVLVTAATWILWTSHHSHANPQWRRARFGAEVADSEIHAAGLIDPLRPVVSRHTEEWKRFALALSLSAHREKLHRLASLKAEERLDVLRQQYLRDRVEHQADRYLRKQRTAAELRLHRWGRLGVWCSLAAVVFVACALVLKVGWPDASKAGPMAFFTLLLPILLPVIASFASAKIISSDAVRRAARYRQVGERLDRMRTLIPAARTAAGLRRIVTETEDILLDEVIEWYASAETLEHLH